MSEPNWYDNLKKKIDENLPGLRARRDEAGRVARRMLPVLKFGTAIVDKIPTSKDTWPQVAAKVLALCDAAAKSANEGRTPMHELMGRYDMVSHQGESFVQLFFGTALQDQFRLVRHKLGDSESAIEATDDRGNKLFFHEYRGSTGAIIDSNFFTSSSMNLDQVLDRVWEQYPHGIFLSVSQNPGEWKAKTTIHPLPLVDLNRASDKAKARLLAMGARHTRFLKDGVHRCYLFYGPPGTGKTTAACGLAKGFGSRILKLDAASLPRMSVGELGFLLEMLRPSFLLLDDVDLAPMEGVGPRVLYLMEHLKAQFPKTAIILTANSPEELPMAWLRCGRIDIPEEFTSPTRPERVQMVKDLLDHHGVVPTLAEGIVSVAEEIDLPHADLEDFCRRLRHESFEEVTASLRSLRALSIQAGNKRSRKKGSNVVESPPSNVPTAPDEVAPSDFVVAG